MAAGNSNGDGGAGLSFIGLLTITFIVLKLCGVIHWPWVWVLGPMWIPALILLVVIIFILFIDKFR